MLTKNLKIFAKQIFKDPKRVPCRVRGFEIRDFSVQSDNGSLPMVQRKWTVKSTENGRSKALKVDGQNHWKWTVKSTKSGRSKALKVDGQKQWKSMVKSTESGRLCPIRWNVRGVIWVFKPFVFRTVYFHPFWLSTSSLDGSLSVLRIVPFQSLRSSLEIRGTLE